MFSPMFQNLTSVCTAQFVSNIGAFEDTPYHWERLRANLSSARLASFLHYAMVQCIVTDKQIQEAKKDNKIDLLASLGKLGFKVVHTQDKNIFGGEQKSGKLHILVANPYEFQKALFPDTEEETFKQRLLEKPSRFLKSQRAAVTLLGANERSYLAHTIQDYVSARSDTLDAWVTLIRRGTERQDTSFDPILAPPFQEQLNKLFKTKGKFYPFDYLVSNTVSGADFVDSLGVKSGMTRQNTIAYYFADLFLSWKNGDFN